MKLFYYDFVLKERVPAEMKTNPVAKFVVFESLDLCNTQFGIGVNKICISLMR